MAEATFTLPRDQFLALALAGQPAAGMQIVGDAGALARLLGWLTPPKPNFPIVTR